MNDNLPVRFVQLMTSGQSPDAAWILATRERDGIPGPMPLAFGQGQLTHEVHTALTSSRQRWAALGLTPPWEAGTIPEQPPAIPRESEAI